MSLFADAARKVVGEKKTATLAKNLQAHGGVKFFGLRINSIEEFFTWQAVFLSLAVAGGTLTMFTGSTPVGALMGLALMYLLYDKVRHGVKTRNKQVMQEDELPAMLEIIAIAVHAGATVEGAIRHAATSRKGLVADWLKEAFAWYDAGTPLDVAIEEVAERVDCRHLLVLARVVSAARKTREGIADILDRAVEDVWLEKEMEARERAGKVSVKLTFPVLFFYFLPGALLIMLPMAAKVVENMKSF